MQRLWHDGNLCHGMGHERSNEDAAVDRARQKQAFTRDAVQFAFWTALALIFVFPLGVALVIFGAPKRVRRFTELYLEAPARDRARARGALDELERRTEKRLRTRTRGRAGPDLAPVRIAHVLDAVLDPLRPRLEERGIALEQRIDGDPVLTADARWLEQAIAHLFAGAVTSIDSAPSGGNARPRLELDAGENLAGTEVWIRLRDSGPEPDAERRLALARPLVEAHEGRIELGPDPAGGTEVVVTLPRD